MPVLARLAIDAANRDARELDLLLDMIVLNVPALATRTDDGWLLIDDMLGGHDLPHPPGTRAALAATAMRAPAPCARP